MLGRLVARPLLAANVSTAAIFRVVESFRPTLLVDEADTFVHDNDELRGILNSGHRKGGTVLRVEGDNHEVRAFATYGACVIACIGELPGTIADRSIHVELKRRNLGEKIMPFRYDRTAHLGLLARQAARWAEDNAISVAASDPDMPDTLSNRAADNWRPLLAIAAVAGGDWPRRLKTAALAHAGTADSALLEMLLADMCTFKPDVRFQKAKKPTKINAVHGCTLGPQPCW